jgi:hypothetical protein
MALHKIFESAMLTRISKEGAGGGQGIAERGAGKATRKGGGQRHARRCDRCASRLHRRS